MGQSVYRGHAAGRRVSAATVDPSHLSTRSLTQPLLPTGTPSRSGPSRTPARTLTQSKSFHTTTARSERPLWTLITRTASTWTGISWAQGTIGIRLMREAPSLWHGSSPTLTSGWQFQASCDTPTVYAIHGMDAEHEPGVAAAGMIAEFNHCVRWRCFLDLSRCPARQP